VAARRSARSCGGGGRGRARNKRQSRGDGPVVADDQREAVREDRGSERLAGALRRRPVKDEVERLVDAALVRVLGAEAVRKHGAEGLPSSAMKRRRCADGKMVKSFG
jgi:hypothetical protein